MIAILVEFTFLAGSIRALHLDKDHSCEDKDNDEIVILFDLVHIEKIRFCLSILIALHVLNSVRLVYKMCVRTNDRFKGKQGICKCLIVDSYCCLGTLAYSYTQITYVFFFNSCSKDDEMRATHNWLTVEFAYQYSQVAVHILTNCCVMGVMLY